MTTTSARLRRVQVRTTAIATAAVLVVLAAGAVGVLRLFEQEQIRRLDATFDDTTRFMEQAAAADSPLLSDRGLVGADALIQAVDEQGSITFASPRLQGRPPMRSAGSGTEPTPPTTVEVEGVGAVRVTAVPFRGNWVLLAISLQNVERSVATLRTVLFVAIPFFAAALGLVLWIVVGRTLRPVRVAIEREEQLVADVSHELRTPIAGVRALLESESRVPEEIELNRLEALAVLARLESMTGSLLAIARHDGAVAAQGAELVDLDEVVLRAVEHATPPAGVAIDVAHVSGGQVRGNEHDLERMVANLVNNAVRHARSRVRITVGERADTVTLVVGDDGPGIAIEDRERIYERFTRLDDARSRDQGGAGLGLPIVRSVVEAHGGTITTGESALGGAEFVVTLRASTVTSAKPPPAAHAPRPPSTEPHPSRDPSASTSA